MLFHHCPPPLSRGRQSNEPSPRPKILLETRRSSTSLVPPTDLPARLEPDLWSKSPVLHKNPKTAVKAWVSHWRLAQSAITCRENIIASYSNPRKTREALQFALKKKTLEIWVWGFRWMSSGLGHVLLFLVIILWRHHPDNEPKLWLKVWLYSRLWYEASEGFFSRGEHQGCSGVGTAFPHLFLACERVPTPFCTSNVTWGCGIRKITLKHGRDLTDELATRRFVYTVKQKDPVWKFL